MGDQKYIIENKNTKEKIRLDICNSFFTKFMGLMFRKDIGKDQGLIFLLDSPSKINAAIHMFFMNFDIAVFWLDDENNIIDKTIAKKWRTYYAPKTPAVKIIETHKNNIDLYEIGETLTFEEN